MEKIAFVSGSATRLGLAIANHLLDEGYGLISHFHQNLVGVNSIQKKAISLKKPFYPIQADFSSAAGIDGLLVGLHDFGQELLCNVEVVVNAAAVMPRGDMGTLTTSELQKVFSINTFAPILINQFFAARATGKISIINISDIGGQMIWNKFAAYSMSKYSLDRSALFLAKQFAPLVRVNTIGLGTIMASEWMDKGFIADLISKIPAGRFAQMDELLSVIDLLVQNEYITGQTINIDGGRSL